MAISAFPGPILWAWYLLIAREFLRLAGPMAHVPGCPLPRLGLSMLLAVFMGSILVVWAVMLMDHAGVLPGAGHRTRLGYR